MPAKEQRCRSCLDGVVATYQAGGATVTTTLAGGGGYDLIADQQAEPLVYDPQHPNRAMRASDWGAGRGRVKVSRCLIGSVLLLLTILAPCPSRHDGGASSGS